MTRPERLPSSAHPDFSTTLNQGQPTNHILNDDDFPQSPPPIDTPDSESFEADMPPSNDKEDIPYNVPQEGHNMLPTSTRPLGAHGMSD
jgi:hypothetical protein